MRSVPDHPSLVKMERIRVEQVPDPSGRGELRREALNAAFDVLGRDVGEGTYARSEHPHVVPLLAVGDDAVPPMYALLERRADNGRADPRRTLPGSESGVLAERRGGRPGDGVLAV